VIKQLLPQTILGRPTWLWEIAIPSGKVLAHRKGFQRKQLYDVVTLLIGVNDQYQGVDTASYRQRFTQSLLKAIELAGLKSHVFVVSIPDYSVTPFVAASDKAKVRQEIDWFNAINLQVSQQMNITYVDIIPSSREGATNAALIAGDGLHPSGLEYKKWAAMLAPLIRQVLQ
jgi:lysophospholipase L1-like esterase